MDRILIALALALTATGCTTLTVVSAGSAVITGRSLTDHGISLATGYDCSITQPFRAEYYCERPVIYNQNGL